VTGSPGGSRRTKTAGGLSQDLSDFGLFFGRFYGLQAVSLPALRQGAQDRRLLRPPARHLPPALRLSLQAAAGRTAAVRQKSAAAADGAVLLAECELNLWHFQHC
jgi:hypothetical protein